MRGLHEKILQALQECTVGVPDLTVAVVRGREAERGGRHGTRKGLAVLWCGDGIFVMEVALGYVKHR